jgi:exodeoxyribonuclease III
LSLLIKVNSLLISESPDILCLNETRINLEYLQQNKLVENYFHNYYTYWNSCVENKGYSGVSIITRYKPLNFSYGINSKLHDTEGRVITLEYEDFYLISVYVPNSGEGLRRLYYRVNQWDVAFFDYILKLKLDKKVIITGDFNVAHTIFDIYDPIGKETQPGFTIDERRSFQSLLDSGVHDTYRHLNPDKKEFTFWANRANSRVGNRGWRLDYFLTSDMESVNNSEILMEYFGSDHCPIKLSLKKKIL